MRIIVDRNVIEFEPETPQETAELEVLWKVVVDCYGDNKKIVPMGNFVPGHDKVARFHIEGVQGGTPQVSPENKVEEDCTYYCAVCNKYKNCKAGEAVPLCCGKEMEPID
jgi:hypothetical protein